MQLESDLILTLIIVLIAIIINYIVGFKSYKSYKKSGVKNTLVLALTAIFMATAMALLILEKVFLMDIFYLATRELFGKHIFGNLAVLFSGLAVIMIDVFAFNMAFPEKAKVLSVISTIWASIYMILFFTDPNYDISTGEISWKSWAALGYSPTAIAIYLTIIPMLFIPILVFIYYAIKIRDQSSTRAKRSIVFALGVASFAFAYTFELIGIDPLISALLRILYITGGLFLYYALFKIKEES